MLVNRQNLARHFAWCILFVVGTIAAVAWYAVASRGAAEWPGGSSWPGLVCGTLAGAIILFEFFLWPRKTLLRIWRIGRTQTWMRAHIWLGLLTVPLIAVHAWKELGGTLSTVLVVLFAVVIASGIFGLTLQQFLPRMLLEQVPAETIYSQVNRVAGQNCDEAEKMVLAVCGSPGDEVDIDPDSHEDDDPAAVAATTTTFVTVGAMRNIGAVRGRVWQGQMAISAVPESGALRAAFAEVIRPYLLAGQRSQSPLSHEMQAANYFTGLRAKLPAATHPVVGQIEGLCGQRRQFDLQMRLHAWLHGWLWVHLPLSVALVLLMFVHIFVALKYW